jgi:hypothetical protein
MLAHVCVQTPSCIHTAPGYEGQLDIYPRSGYVVAVLTNQDQTMVPVIQRSETILTRS